MCPSFTPKSINLWLFCRLNMRFGVDANQTRPQCGIDVTCNDVEGKCDVAFAPSKASSEPVKHRHFVVSISHSNVNIDGIRMKRSQQCSLPVPEVIDGRHVWNVTFAANGQVMPIYVVSTL